jgi:ABC-type ATPase involved in cell division
VTGPDLLPAGEPTGNPDTHPSLIVLAILQGPDSAGITAYTLRAALAMLGVIASARSVALAAGLLFRLCPASRAARLNRIEALRYG